MKYLDQWMKLDRQIFCARSKIFSACRSCACGAALARTNRSKRCHLCAVRIGNNLRILPADFTEFAPGRTNVELMAHYGCCADVITRFRKESGVRSTHGVREAPKMPADFHLVAPTLTKKQLRDRYHRADPTINRWLIEAKVDPARHVPAPPTPAVKKERDPAPTNLGRAVQAADFLSKLGPVSRCDDQGHFDAGGYFWRRGSFVLNPDEIIARALCKNWQPDAWREVRAA
jgi:hypothetical protein